MAEALETNQTLQSLNLACSNIGSEGAQVLIQMIKNNPRFPLQTLCLARNHICDGVAKALAVALETNQTLQSLDLRGNAIGSEGMQALARALDKNQVLRVLNLGWMEINKTDMQVLADVLKTNQSLHVLKLVGAHINDKKAKRLAEALKVNRGLYKLDLTCNFSIRDQGAIALGEALKTNQTLLRLILTTVEDIGDEGVKALGEALESNQTLLELCFDDDFEWECDWRFCFWPYRKYRFPQRVERRKSLLKSNKQIADAFLKLSEAVKGFLTLQDNEGTMDRQGIAQLYNFLQEVKNVELSLEKIVQRSNRAGLDEEYKNRLQELRNQLSDLLLNKLHRELLAMPAEGVCQDGDPELAKDLFQLWEKFFGLECFDRLVPSELLRDEVFQLLRAMVARAKGENFSPSAEPHISFQALGVQISSFPRRRLVGVRDTLSQTVHSSLVTYGSDGEGLAG